MIEVSQIWDMDRRWHDADGHNKRIPQITANAPLMTVEVHIANRGHQDAEGLAISNDRTPPSKTTQPRPAGTKENKRSRLSSDG
jgi:hypothetical protein